MQPTTTEMLVSPIPVPEIDSDVPAAIIPIASVAPLDGPPDGERINTFAVAPKNRELTRRASGGGALAGLRDRVISRPLTYVAAAVSLGFVLARLRR
ncbi:hypothetical protein JJB11_25820 [Ramlibacter ginsenosidimutans]|uniref:Uncharacterized protein n=1 Tax=Ramlibacter ginsenosidimutans TaxID=502333 RepID=A0A934U2E5_9BURK|nr:hypothetical protein [Ramlibacter ginsenosidimutans]MBK6009532.1 hypothetical protein [Ramlibacter ginsenosidimutans]